MIKIFFILNKKGTSLKNGCVGDWLLALPRTQMTRLSRILGVWFTYYVPVLINFMTPSKHLSIVYQGINLRGLLRFFFLEQSSSCKEGKIKTLRLHRYAEKGMFVAGRRIYWIQSKELRTILLLH